MKTTAKSHQTEKRMPKLQIVFLFLLFSGLFCFASSVFAASDKGTDQTMQVTIPSSDTSSEVGSMTADDEPPLDGCGTLECHEGDPEKREVTVPCWAGGIQIISEPFNLYCISCTKDEDCAAYPVNPCQVAYCAEGEGKRFCAAKDRDCTKEVTCSEGENMECFTTPTPVTDPETGESEEKTGCACVGDDGVASNQCTSDADCQDTQYAGHCVRTEPNGKWVCQYSCDSYDDCPDPGNQCDEPVCNADAGICGTRPIDCDDGIECTADSCEIGKGCVHDPDDSVCENTGQGGECVGYHCDAQQGCVPGYDDSLCTDGGECEVGTCDVNTGNCHYIDDPTLCSDPNSSCVMGDCVCDPGYSSTPGGPCEPDEACPPGYYEGHGEGCFTPNDSLTGSLCCCPSGGQGECDAYFGTCVENDDWEEQEIAYGTCEYPQVVADYSAGIVNCHTQGSVWGGDCEFDESCDSPPSPIIIGGSSC